MLSKCANPDCSATFRYFGQGKLFEVDSRKRVPDEDGLDSFAAKKAPRSVERFWLCSRCSETMTLAVDRACKLRLLRRPGPVRAAAS